MKNVITTLTLAACATAQAGTATWFTPLTESAPVTTPNSPEELTQPWVAPEGLSQKNIVSLREVEDQVLSYGQSIVRVPDLGSNGSMIDMIAYDPSGNFLFLPHETLVGAGVSRVNLYTCETEIVFAGDTKGNMGDWSNDFGAFDPARFTPNGTVIAAEEWSGQGRVIECLNPYADREDVEIRELHSFANVSHEGINFSNKYNDTVYFVDEDHSGSIYKFVMKTPGDYTVGQTFVLSVDAFAFHGGDAALNWDGGSNRDIRTGEASWVAISDEEGNPLPGLTDAFTWTEADGRPGRTAANEVGGTPFGRPEDCEVGTLANGNEVLYFAATSENTVYSVEMMQVDIPGRWNRVGRRWVWSPAHTVDKAMVRVFASDSGTPKNEGFASTTAVINSPDNLAQDALGNIYIIEDAPNSSDTGGDIWFVRDTNNDGVGESVDHFLSLRVRGAEATGMIWNPVYPEEFVVAVQHPASTNLDEVDSGLGDAVWMFNVTNIPDQTFVHQLIQTQSR
ncbi:alkaline phosphatase PhoX [Roseibacillus ishigakijimensis]|uniref:DUF839 domain-containing protein n=1 Tax=Roseibacillus ishigakijimensis TaxID=454146 RepID=A0A934RK36_9BACT|nr:alkaline phosphatase PhoX [Roseibacillus ishigakijimensis]MBK1832889.1 DUF839 domain-containing protein [Roseibacillus ishigakijimensis]